MQQHTPATNGILNRSIIRERSNDADSFLLVTGCNGGFFTFLYHLAYVQRGIPHHAPAKDLKAITIMRLLPYSGYAAVYFRIVLAINERLYMFEQLQLFIYFLPHIHKPFAVRFSNIGKYANGRLNDLLQLFHFAG